MEIKKVVVVGSGTMGAGIAQLCSQKGLEAVITDINLELADKGKARLEKGLSKRVAKGKITEEDKQDVLSRISTAGDLTPVKDADIVIESAVEKLEIKKEIFAELDKLAKPGVILATNTTSLSISAMAQKHTAARWCWPSLGQRDSPPQKSVRWRDSAAYIRPHSTPLSQFLASYSGLLACPVRSLWE